MEDNTIKISHLLFIILMMGIVIVVSTYAYLKYRSNDTAMVLTIGEINNVQVTLSPYQIKASLLPQVTYNSDNYVSVTAVNNSTNARSFRLFYKINSIDNELISSDFKYTIERSTDGTTYSQYKTGNFSSASNGGELTILEERITGNNTTYNYKVYLWIDGTNIGQSYMQGKSFNGELRAEIASSQYQFVEYLESKGTQYINTEFIPTTTTNMEIDFKYLGAGASSWVPICGERSGNSSTYMNFFIHAVNLKITPNYAGYDPGNGSGFDPISVGVRYKLKNQGGNFYLDDELKDSTTNTLTVGTTPIYIFAIGSGSGVDSRQLYIQLYSFKIFNNNELMMHLLPAYRKSDGIRGLYDIVNDDFYTNAGSGTFDIGPEV